MNVTDPTTDILKVDAVSPVVVVAPDGAQTMAWVSGIAAGDPNRRIEVATRPAGATGFGPRTVVGTGNRAGSPAIAAGADGTEAITWIEAAAAGSGYVHVVVSVHRAGSTTWSTPAVVSESGILSSPVVAITEGGTIKVAWVQKLYSGFRVDGLDFTAGSEEYGAAHTLLNGGLLSISPRLAVGPDGTIAVAWLGRSSGVNRVVASTTAASGLSFGPSQVLSAKGRGAGSIAVGIGDGGAVTVAWRRDRDRTAASGEASCRRWGRVQSSSRLAGHWRFGGAETLSATVRMSCGIAAAASPDGSSTVVWSRVKGTFRIIESASRAPGRARWAAPVTISGTAHQNESPAIAAAPDGTMTAAWLQFDGGRRVRAATRRPSSSRFSASLAISGLLTEPTAPTVTPGPDRNLVVWRGVSNGHRVIQAVATVPR